VSIFFIIQVGFCFVKETKQNNMKQIPKIMCIFRATNRFTIETNNQIIKQMKNKNQHVVPRDGEWAVKRGGSNRATVVVPTQKEAIEIGKEIAKNQNSELFIHGKNGQIRERESYGNDEYPPKG
jgi:hypothetical protein